VTEVVASALRIGTRIDQYEVLRPLGRGGMAEVFLVRDTVLGRRAALKLIEPGPAGPDAQLLNEARAMAHFNHPNIVTIFGVGNFDSRAYIAMEYVEGETLRERMQKQQLSSKEALRLALAVASALEEAHGRGIVHSDLKPENVIIGRDGRLRVLDFGLARGVRGDALTNEGPAAPIANAPSGAQTTQRLDTQVLSDKLSQDRDLVLSSASEVMGTPMYMAPEQWRNEGKTASIDVWAFGTILFEMLAGRRPFVEQNLLRLCVRVTSEESAPSLNAHAEASPDIAQLVARCLAKNPSQRPSSGECAHLLFQLVHGLNARSEAEDASPFRGLSAFNEEHAAFFFGRDEEIAQFIERLRTEPVLPIIGASGVGKSSFIQAGVIPRLKEQGDWRVIRLRPGSQPLRVLAERFSRNRSEGLATRKADLLDASMPTTIDGLAEALYDNPKLLALWLLDLAKTNNCRVLLLVDQMEEVCTLVSDEITRQKFLAAVCNAADDAQSPVRVVFTVRDDFLTRLAHSPDARQALTQVAVLRAPGNEALRAIIENPLKVVGFRYDTPAIADDMITAVENEGAALPLLQFCAQMLWERRNRSDKLLTRASYDAIGGVQGALATHANAFMKELSEAQARLVRTAMLRLVTPEGTRRVMGRDALVQALGAGGEEVVLGLSTSRLLSVREVLGEVQLELSHESLVHTWDRLVTWLDEGHEELVFTAQLEQSAELWDKRGRPRGEVWTKNALLDAERNLDRFRIRLVHNAQAFIEASRAAERLRIRIRTGLVIAGALSLVLIALVSVVTAAQFAAKTRIAEEREAQALAVGARSAYQRGDYFAAKAQLRRSLEVADTMAARGLWTQLKRDPIVWKKSLADAVLDVVYGPTGSLWVSVADGQPLAFDVTTGDVSPLRGNIKPLYRLAYSARDSLLAAGDDDGTVVAWRLGATPKLERWKMTGGFSQALVFSGGRLAALGDDSRLTLRNLSDGVMTWVPMTVASVAWRGLSVLPGERLALTGPGPKEVSVLDGERFEWTRKLEDLAPLMTLASTADGRRLAVGAEDGSIAFIEGEAHAVVSKRGAHGASVSAVAFSPNGAQLASASWDGAVNVWELPSLTPVSQVKLHSSGASSVKWLDDHTVVSGGYDNQLIAFDVRSNAAALPVLGHSAEVLYLTFAHHDVAIFSGDAKGVIVAWQAETGLPIKTWSEHTGPITSVAVSADGRRVAMGSQDRRISVFDAETLTLLKTFVAHDEQVLSLCFGLSNDVLVSTSQDGGLAIWDLTQWKVARRDKTPHRVSSIARLSGDSLLFGMDDEPERHAVYALGSGRFSYRQGGAYRIDHPSGLPRYFGLERSGVVTTYALDGQVLRRASLPVPGGSELVATPGAERDELLVLSGDRDLWWFDGSVWLQLGMRDRPVKPAWSSNGASFAVGGFDTNVRLWRKPTALHTQAMWRLQSASPLTNVRATGESKPLERSDTSRTCSYASDGTIRSGFVRSVPPQLRSFAATRDGCLSLHAGGQLFFTTASGVEKVSDNASAHALTDAGAGVVFVSNGTIFHRDLRTATSAAIGRVSAGSSAVFLRGDDLAIGFSDGTVELRNLSTNAQRLVTISGAPSRSVSVIEAVDARLLLLGYASGEVFLVERISGDVLDATRVLGTVERFSLREGDAVAVSDLGFSVSLSLADYTLNRCEILGSVWRSIAADWREGHVVAERTDDSHECAVQRP
jgi:serine/threonine protein kinase/WD40 repeat protein